MIELFKEPNIDWMGKAKYFYALSGILLLAGWTSIFLHGGLRYSIDFKGGTNVDVRFAQPPNIDKIRAGLTAQGLGNTEIQSVSDIASPNSNEVLIFVEQKNQGDEAGDASKTQVINALNAIYGTASSSKPDFNSATLSSLTAFLTQQRSAAALDERRRPLPAACKKDSRLSRHRRAKGFSPISMSSRRPMVLPRRFSPP